MLHPDHPGVQTESLSMGNTVLSKMLSFACQLAEQVGMLYYAL